jgi:hypothetical protein
MLQFAPAAEIHQPLIDAHAKDYVEVRSETLETGSGAVPRLRNVPTGSALACGCRVTQKMGVDGTPQLIATNWRSQVPF